jgi:hypothetical protein
MITIGLLVAIFGVCVTLLVQSQVSDEVLSDTHSAAPAICQPAPPPALSPSNLFSSGGQVVSGVASPVTSVVVSNVTSPVGTSRVASAVTTPVASAVAVSTANNNPQMLMNLRTQMNVTEFRTLTAGILEAIAQRDLAINPTKYTLSQWEKERIIALYSQAHPEQLISPDWIKNDAIKFSKEKALLDIRVQQEKVKKTVLELKRDYKPVEGGKIESKFQEKGKK